jgi:hypothetical protein
MESTKEEAIRKLIAIFAREFPRRNHVILVDMSTGSYRIDEMLAQEIVEKTDASSHPGNVGSLSLP